MRSQGEWWWSWRWSLWALCFFSTWNGDEAAISSTVKASLGLQDQRFAWSFESVGGCLGVLKICSSFALCRDLIRCQPCPATAWTFSIPLCYDGTVQYQSGCNGPLYCTTSAINTTLVQGPWFWDRQQGSACIPAEHVLVQLMRPKRRRYQISIHLQHRYPIVNLQRLR